MKYWCSNCGQVVDDYDVISEEHYEDGFLNPYESEWRCPYCGEELGAEEAKECPICGEWMDPERVICEDCEDEISVYVDMWLDGFAFDKDIYKEEAREYVKYWLEQKGVIDA